MPWLQVLYDWADRFHIDDHIFPRNQTLMTMTVLDLTDFQISELPVEFGNLTELKHLYLNDNLLTQLPDSMGHLTQLKTLHINFNELTQLPDSITNLTQLIELDLWSNCLKKLPDALGTLVNLQQLDVSDNQLRHLPDSMGKLVQLKQLVIKENPLKNLPDSINHLAEYINIDIQSIKQTHDDLQALKKWADECHIDEDVFPRDDDALLALEELTINRHNHYSNKPNSENSSCGQIKDLPSQIGVLTNLKKLCLKGHSFNTVPERIGDLTQLTLLDLSHNNIQVLPESIGKLSQLTQLYIQNNQLTTLPNSVEQLSQLKVLKIYRNKFTAPPKMTLNLTLFCDLTAKETGDWVNILGMWADEFDIDDSIFPKTESELLQLEDLHIDGSAQYCFGSEEELYRIIPKINYIPEEIAHLKNLSSLSLPHHSLTTLPVGISLLDQLIDIDVSDNLLNSLPDDMAKLTELEMLDVSDNELQTLPKDIQNLENIYLIIDGNPMNQLPDKIKAFIATKDDDYDDDF